MNQTRNSRQTPLIGWDLIPEAEHIIVNSAMKHTKWVESDA
jgi:hypothetical protein